MLKNVIARECPCRIDPQILLLVASPKDSFDCTIQAVFVCAFPCGCVGGALAGGGITVLVKSH